MINFLFFFYVTAFAQNPLIINGQTVYVNKVSRVDGSVTAAELSFKQSLKIGRNQFKDIPAGTSVNFFTNEQQEQPLKLHGLIITKKTPNQIYILKNGKKALLNCGRFKSSVAFVEFSKDGELLNGCRSALNQPFKIPNQSKEITVHEFSPISLFENGLLRSAALSSGTLELEENKIQLLPNGSIGFHLNEKLHFFQPDHEEVFYLSTQISDRTRFYQPEKIKSFPVLFHSNGAVSTGWTDLEYEFAVTIKAFGTDLNVTSQRGPIGFDVNGQVDRLLLKKSVNLIVSDPTYVRSTEQSTGAVSRGLFRPGANVDLPSQTQLFLDNNGGFPRLSGYPEFGQHGLAFFNELSLKPF